MKARGDPGRRGLLDTRTPGPAPSTVPGVRSLGTGLFRGGGVREGLRGLLGSREAAQVGLAVLEESGHTLGRGHRGAKPQNWERMGSVHVRGTKNCHFACGGGGWSRNRGEVPGQGAPERCRQRLRPRSQDWSSDMPGPLLGMGTLASWHRIADGGVCIQRVRGTSRVTGGEPPMRPLGPGKGQGSCVHRCCQSDVRKDPPGRGRMNGQSRLRPPPTWGAGPWDFLQEPSAEVFLTV